MNYTGPTGIRQYLADSNNLGLDKQHHITPEQAPREWGVPVESIDGVQGTWVESKTKYDPFTIDWQKEFGIDPAGLDDRGCHVRGNLLVICGSTALAWRDTLTWFVLEASDESSNAAKTT
jgi:hypothetical protein